MAMPSRALRYLGRMSSEATPQRPPARAGATLVVVALLIAAAIVTGCGTARAHATTQASAPAASAAAAPAARISGAQTVSITAATVGNAVPAGFVGLSIEEKALQQFAGTNPRSLNPAFVHLLADLSPGGGSVLRIGGDSTDWSWYPIPHVTRPPGVRFSLSPGWMSVARSLASSLNGKLILGVDLEADSRAIAAGEANAMVRQIGRQYIDALELGNEPELYGSFGWYKSATGQQVPGRPRSWNPAAYNSNFGQIAAGLPSGLVAGPSMGGPHWLALLGSFVSANPRLRLVTVHAYPLKHCTKATVVTIPELLADSSSHGLAVRVAPFLAAAARRHLPLRIDEMNGISCGGTRGVSNTFTSALWVLDTLFEMARGGVDGVNIHTVPNTINEILGPVGSGNHSAMRVHPEFYGMMMFAQAAPAGSHLVRIADRLPQAIKVWATRSPDGSMHVVVINKRLSGSVTVGLRIAGAGAPATVEALRASSVHATGGVTLGGQTFGAATSTGVLGGHLTQGTLTSKAGTYTLSVPAASATMLAVPKS
jgi:hypothetical protein